MAFSPTTALKKIAALKTKIRAVCGGTSASKTISILMYLIHRAQSDKTPTLTSVVSESLPHLKRGALRDFKNIMTAHGYWKDQNWRATDYVYEFETGSQIEFFGVDSPDKLRGGRRDRLFINEANNVSLDAFDQLEVRTKEFAFLDWNPSHEFWFYTEVQPNRKDVEFITLTYKHNEALSEEIVSAIEARQGNKMWWQVYGLGQLGEIETRIYTRWNVIDDIPEGARLEVRGMDFGYSNDPTSIVDIYKYNQGYILDQQLYRKGLSNKQIADIIQNLDDPRCTVVADSAEPKSIDELNSYGVTAIPAEKGPGSVTQGIQLVQGIPISVTKRSVDLLKEYRNYLWLEDKDGKVLNKPTPGMDHCFVGKTKVQTKNCEKNIEDIKAGDWVLTSGGYKRVLIKHDNGMKTVYQYLLRTDTHQVIITCTPEHKVKTGETWTKISKLKKGQTVSLFRPSLEVDSVAKSLNQDTEGLLNSAIITAKLEHLEVVGKWKERVFDLTVEENHEYFANGILVHNCMDALRYGIQFLNPYEEESDEVLAIY